MSMAMNRDFLHGRSTQTGSHASDKTEQGHATLEYSARDKIAKRK